MCSSDDVKVGLRGMNPSEVIFSRKGNIAAFRGKKMGVSGIGKVFFNWVIGEIGKLKK